MVAGESGGLIQLTVYGTQDIFLTGSPQITFFKIVYRRHTNFAVESVRQQFFGEPDFGAQNTCLINKVGDLMYRTYIEVTLPKVDLMKPVGQYNLSQTIAATQAAAANAFYEVMFNYITADADLTRRINELLTTNNIPMKEIHVRINDPAFNGSLVKYRNALIDFIQNSDIFDSIKELQSIKFLLPQEVNQVDVVILLNSIYTRTRRFVHLPEEEVSLLIRRESLVLIHQELYQRIKNFYLIAYDLKLQKDKINVEFQKKEYKERYQFAWVEEIGHVIIDQVNIRIGTEQIDRHTGDWLIVWNKMTLDPYQRRNYDKMIGQVPELTVFDDKIKNEYILRIPLLFWYCRNNGLALPLVALRYHDVLLEVAFKKLELCCYVEDNPSLADIDNIQNQYGIHIKDVTIYVDYIYLDFDERRRFAQSAHEYLIETVQYNQFTYVQGDKYRASLDFAHPSKFIVWYCQPNQYRENPTGRNKCQWNNFGINPDKTGQTLANTVIRINSYQRVSSTIDQKYYNYVDSYEHFRLSSPDGLYSYSYALKPMDYQPSSTLNASRIDDYSLSLKFTPEFLTLVENNPITSPGIYIAVYQFTYNIIRIMSGFAALAFQVST